MNNAHSRGREKDESVDNLLCEFSHEIEGHASEMCVANEIVEIEGEQLKDKTEMVAVFKVADESNYCVNTYLTNVLVLPPPPFP